MEEIMIELIICLLIVCAAPIIFLLVNWNYKLKLAKSKSKLDSITTETDKDNNEVTKLKIEVAELKSKLEAANKVEVDSNSKILEELKWLHLNSESNERKTIIKAILKLLETRIEDSDPSTTSN